MSALRRSLRSGRGTRRLVRGFEDGGLAAGSGAQGSHVEEARPEAELRPETDLPRRFLAAART
jgi:hypothetical protein